MWFRQRLPQASRRSSSGGDRGLPELRACVQRTLTNNGEQSTSNCGASNQAEDDKSQYSASALPLARTGENLKGIGRHGGPCYVVVLPLAGRSWEAATTSAYWLIWRGQFGASAAFGDPCQISLGAHLIGLHSAW